MFDSLRSASYKIESGETNWIFSGFTLKTVNSIETVTTRPGAEFSATLNKHSISSCLNSGGVSQIK
jgi:hypothetical protein